MPPGLTRKMRRIHPLQLVTTVTLAIIACGAAPDQLCPSRCRSCNYHMAECSQQSLTAPPRLYPRGTKLINLEGNHIRVLAERTFSDLDSVEVLKVGGNKIVALRNHAFSAFPGLLNLDLADNRISKISKLVFQKLGQLQTLSISRNKIESLEGFLTYVPKLFQLNLANNRITAIGQHDLAPLTNVHYLDLRDNLIASIHPEAFKKLANLRYLFLNSNPLVTTPSFQFSSQVLQLVDFSHCDLKTVPGPFPPSVGDLRLGQNQIMQVKRTDLLNITELQLLTLNDNQLHFLEDGSLSHLTQLQEIWLRQNSLVYIPRNLPDSVRKIHADSNNIQQIEVGLFNEQSHLDYLTVENNQINRIKPNTFRGLRFLSTLNFQGNQLQKLETATFVDLPSLNTILLSSNPLKIIEDGAFGNLLNLTRLLMSHIDVEEFEMKGNFFREMSNLQMLELTNSPALADELMAFINDSSRINQPLDKLTHLDLSYNNLQWISPRMREIFPNLLSLPLDGNPLRCSRKLKWLRDWMVSSEVQLNNHNHVVCETPSRLQDRPVSSLADHEWAEDSELDGSEVTAATDQRADLNQEDTAQNDAGASSAQRAKQRRVLPSQGMSKRSKDDTEQAKKDPKDTPDNKTKKPNKKGKSNKKDKSNKDRNKKSKEKKEKQQ